MFFDDVYRTAFYILRDQELAKDTAHDTFIKAFEKVDTIEDHSKIKAWLRVIASRTAIDLLRKKNNWNSKMDYGAEVEGDYLPASLREDQVEMKVLQNLSKQILLKGIEELTPEARQILYMRYKLDMKLEDIAKETDLPIGTVKARLFRTHQKLSKILTEKYQLRGEDAL